MADRTMRQLKAQISRARKRRKVVAASIHLDAQCIVCGTWYKLSGVGQAVGRRTCSRSCRRKINPEPPESRRERDRRRNTSEAYLRAEKARREERKDAIAQYNKESWKRHKDQLMAEYLDNPTRHCADCGTPHRWEDRRRTRCEQCGIARTRAASNEYNNARYQSDPEYRARMIANAHARRARQLNTQAEPINPMIVFNRDAWKCQRLGCGKTTRIDVNRNASNRAVLGHINALAAGGTHTYDNVCCLCHPCNVADGVNKATIQRSLIA